MQCEIVKLEMPVSNITADSLEATAKEFGVSPSSLTTYLLNKGFSNLAKRTRCKENKKKRRSK